MIFCPWENWPDELGDFLGPVMLATGVIAEEQKSDSHHPEQR